VVMLLATDANLYKFAFGVIDRFYEVFVKGDVNSISKKEKRVQHYIQYIKASEELMQLMKKQAKQNKQSLEKEIRANAAYYFWKENNK